MKDHMSSGLKRLLISAVLLSYLAAAAPLQPQPLPSTSPAADQAAGDSSAKTTSATAVYTPSTISDGGKQVVAKTTFKEKSRSEAELYLKRFGYLGGDGVKSKNSLTTGDDYTTALKRLQVFAGLDASGILDGETQVLMNRPRCQLPDRSTTSKRKRRFVVGSKWDDPSDLTYTIDSYPTNSLNFEDETDVDSTLATSFKDWSSVANINFRPAPTNSNPKITVNFYRRLHGDGYGFDGVGGVLAHAFFPPYGQLHFDDDEHWAVSSPRGPSLRQVGTHEIGHLLGLDHTDVRDAVMYPYYSYDPDFQLHSDDVDGVVRLYGKRRPQAAETTTTVPESLLSMFKTMPSEVKSTAFPPQATATTTTTTKSTTTATTTTTTTKVTKPTTTTPPPTTTTQTTTTTATTTPTTFTKPRPTTVTTPTTILITTTTTPVAATTVTSSTTTASTTTEPPYQNWWYWHQKMMGR